MRPRNNTFLIETDLFKARLNGELIVAEIATMDGGWVQSLPFPNNPIGYSGVLDLAMQVLSGKLVLANYKGKLKAPALLAGKRKKIKAH